jgi:uncharacterized protein YggE
MGFCDQLNINITADTFEEATKELDETVMRVLASMSDEELKIYNISKVDQKVKIKIQYKIPEQSLLHKDLVIL